MLEYEFISCGPSAESYNSHTSKPVCSPEAATACVTPFPASAWEILKGAEHIEGWSWVSQTCGIGMGLQHSGFPAVKLVVS